jgi:hypothetical protein
MFSLLAPKRYFDSDFIANMVSGSGDVCGDGGMWNVDCG